MLINPQLCEEIGRLFVEAGKAEAGKFLLVYRDYIHAIDDVVDEEQKIGHIQHVGLLANILFSSNYWAKNKDYLGLVEQITNLTYFDSIEWENSEVEWKRWDAKCLSHCGYNMIFAVMLLELGIEVTKQYTLRIREQAHSGHINDMIPLLKAI